jgi:hypothetical protein
MDFSLIDTQYVQWSVKQRAKSLQCLQKIRFQVPRTSLKIASCPKFDGALDVHVNSTTFPREFHEFIDALIDTIPDDMIEDRTYYDPWKKLTAFDDVLVFDAEEHIIKNVLGYHDASLLIQVDGVWLTERSWGFRFRIVQIKLHRQHIRPIDPEPPVRIFVRGSPYLFVRDD